MKNLSILSLSLLTGCGSLFYPNDPVNSVKLNKGAFGTELQITNRTDTNVTIESAEYKPDNKLFVLKGLSFESTQSRNQKELVQWMMQFNTNRQIEWENFNTNPLVIGGGQTLGQVGGLIGQRLQIDRAKIDNRRALIDVLSQVMGAVGPEIVDEAKANIPTTNPEFITNP